MGLSLVDNLFVINVHYTPYRLSPAANIRVDQCKTFSESRDFSLSNDFRTKPWYLQEEAGCLLLSWKHIVSCTGERGTCCRVNKGPHFRLKSEQLTLLRNKMFCDWVAFFSSWKLRRNRNGIFSTVLLWQVNSKIIKFSYAENIAAMYFPKYDHNIIGWKRYFTFLIL